MTRPSTLTPEQKAEIRAAVAAITVPPERLDRILAAWSEMDLRHRHREAAGRTGAATGGQRVAR